MSTVLDQQPADDVESQPVPSPGLLNIAWRFKLLILLGTVVGVVIGYVYAAQLPPSYRSSAKMLVLAEEQDGAGLDVIGLMLSASRPLGQRFLEPVVGERLVVERSHLGPAG